ncbi:MAG: methyl-accepting chemotaxis protein [Gammaproteobacteria bacterium]
MHWQTPIAAYDCSQNAAASTLAQLILSVIYLNERPHILALNASMHAAAVGDAGRSFSAIADEVQRLAENAREMTGQLQDVVRAGSDRFQ